MRPSINLRYKSLLLTCLLILATGVVVPAWGQYTIIPSTQEKVTERVDTVYVKDGVARELFVPELRNNDGHDGNDPRYKWYVRWYRKGKFAKQIISYQIIYWKKLGKVPDFSNRNTQASE